MAAQEHKNYSLKALCNGMVLSLANDLNPKGKFNFLKNIRVKTEGILESRPKVDLLLELDYITNDVPHSIKTILNKDNDSFNRIVGVGSKICTGNTSPLVTKDTGYSGKPLSIVDFRPEEAIEAYAYIADSNKMSKISVSDLLKDIGIAAPTKALTFKIDKPTRKIIDNITTADIGDWNHLTGSAGVPAAVARINTTIVQILYDDGNAAPNFASIVPAAFPDDLQVGVIVTLNSADDVIVEEINPATLLTGAATVSKISYDNAPTNTGLCTIVLSTSNVDIERNSILYLNSSEYVRVLEVTRDANNIPSIRTKTIGTIAATNTVVGKAAFRIYATGTYAATQAIFAEYLSTAIGAAGISSITKTIDIDLTIADNKPLTDDDILHFSFQASDTAQINEVQLQLDCNNGAQNFTDNSFYYVLTPNFLLSSANQSASSLASIQQFQQRREILAARLRDRNINSSDIPHFREIEFEETSFINEVSLGIAQWTEVFIRIGDLKRIGSDDARTKKDIKAIRLSIDAKAAVTIFLDSIWIGGGHDLETRVSGFLPYNYVWRVRDQSTGVFSNWSPPMREGVKISRGTASLTFTSANSDFSTDYVIDVARFGGSLNDYRIIGTVKNDGSTFTDNVSDRTAAQNDPASRRLKGDQIGDEEVFDFYKPFVFLDSPKKGICSIVGTKFTWVSGDTLNTSYPRGVQLLIDSKLNSFYSNPTSTTKVELEKDMGSLTNVNFEIKAPLLTGQALPIIFGPFGEGNSGLFIFGIGNKKAAGTLYWLDGNSPDTQSDINFLEITSPSEPLLAGVMYDGYAFIYTTRRSFYLTPTFQTGGLGFIARENANSRGVFSPYSICVGRDFIYFLSENADGIYKVPGSGNPVSLTDGSLYNLFIHNGILPEIITLIDGTIIYPPDYDQPEQIRLFYCRDVVIWRFIDVNNKHVSLIYDERIGDWISYDTYLDDRINAFYEEEIESSVSMLVGIKGAMGVFSDSSSREDNIKSEVLPFSMDFGDSNLLKRVDEVVFDVNPGTKGFDYTILYNNGTSFDTLKTVLGSVSPTRLKLPKTIGTEIENLARNITNKLEWTLSSGVKFYEEQFYYLIRADLIVNRPGDDDDNGSFNDKYWEGIVIEADTFGVNKTLKWINDDGTIVATQVINHNGKIARSYSFDVPFISHMVTRYSDDDVPWIFYQEKYDCDVEPELGKVWEPQETTLGIQGFKVIKRVAIALRSFADVNFRIYYDGLTDFEDYPLSSTNGIKDKRYFFLRPRKGIVIRFKLTSEIAFRVYQNDLEIWIRQYNDQVRQITSQGNYSSISPFGDKDYTLGSII